MWVNEINMLKEPLAMFHLLDDKSVSQSFGGSGVVLMALYPYSLMNRLANKGLVGEPMPVAMDLFIILTLEEETYF